MPDAQLQKLIEGLVNKGEDEAVIKEVIKQWKPSPQAQARTQADTDAPAYLGEMLGNIKDDAWNQGANFLKGITQLPAMVSGAVSESRNKVSDKVLDTLGLDAYMSDKPRMNWRGETVAPASQETPNLDALKAGAIATGQHYADYLDPEKRALQVRDRPVETVMDLLPVGGFLAKTPAMVRSGGAAVNRAAQAARATAAAHPVATELAVNSVPFLGRARQTLKTIASTDRNTQAIKEAAVTAERLAAEKLARQAAAKATKDAERAAAKTAADAAATEAARVKELKRVADEASLRDPRLAPAIESELGPKVEDILKKEPVGPVDEGPLRAVMDEHMANREAQGPRAERRSGDLITEGLEDYPARPTPQFPREDVPGLVRDELSSMEGAADWALGDVARSPSPRPVTTPATRLPPGKPLTTENFPGYAEMSPADQAFVQQYIEAQLKPKAVREAEALAVKNQGKTPAVVVPKAAAPATPAAAAAAETAAPAATRTGTAWAPGEVPHPAPRPAAAPEAPAPRPDITPEPVPPVREAGPATDLGPNAVTPEPAPSGAPAMADAKGKDTRRVSYNEDESLAELARKNPDLPLDDLRDLQKVATDQRRAFKMRIMGHDISSPPVPEAEFLEWYRAQKPRELTKTGFGTVEDAALAKFRVYQERAAAKRAAATPAVVIKK